MRNCFWQRLALILLLVSRLIIGEIGHAMPASHSADMSMHAHHQMAASSSGAMDHAACHGHEASAHSSGKAESKADSKADNKADKKDCCKAGECACLHVPCAAFDELLLSPCAAGSLRIPDGVDGLVSQRPSGLFRPPA